MCDEDALAPEDQLWAVLWWMSAEERVAFIDRWMETWCMACGEANHRGECKR